MQYSYAAVALAGLAAAAPHNSHANFHKKDIVEKDIIGDVFSGVESMVGDMVKLASVGNTFITSIAGGDGAHVAAATNSHAATSDSWIGEATEGNAVVNTIVNKSGKDATWLCWGSDASWGLTNPNTPAKVAITVPAGSNATVSHAVSQDSAKGNSGACAPMFKGDGLNIAAQAKQAWMEFTFVAGQYTSSTYDLSMEVNANGHNMTIAGDECKSSMTECSFHCKDAGAESCWEAGSYYLKNCAVGSQKAANIGQLNGNDEGGCQGISNTGITKLITTLH